MEKEEVKEEVKEEKESKEKKDSKKNNKLWFIIIGIIVIILIILLCLHSCGNSKKYKIKLHYGDETIEVDKNFKLSDLEVEGGTISFLVDSDGNIIFPGEKLDPNKEYSAHIIPNGKETVKVTYKIDSKKNTVTYQKGAGLLFPKTPTKKGYVFITWKFEDKEDYPTYMMPVNEDMTLIAIFEKSKMEEGKCTLNCDTNKDGMCDLNCDANGDKKPDFNIDTDGDGKRDLNINTGRGGKPYRNVDTNGDGKCDYNCDTNNDGVCDENCNEDALIPDINKGKMTFGCDDYSYAYAWFGKFGQYEHKFVSLVFDGKNIPESEFKKPTESDPSFLQALPIKVYNYGKDYIGSGKTVDIDMHVIIIDYTGQKYYQVDNRKFIFEGNCDKKSDVNKVEYIHNTKPGCENEPVYVGLPYRFLQEKGLVVNENSTIKVLNKHLDGDSSYPYYDCGINSEGAFYWSIGRDDDLGYDNAKMKKRDNLIDSREGKTTTDTCQVEVITDGQKYLVDLKFVTKYADYCSNKNDEKKTYTLTYNANGGSVSPANKSLKDGETFGNLPTPTRNGYTFNGWYTSANGGSKVSSNTKISTNTTIYAHWTKKEEPQQQEPTPPPQDNGTISLSASNTCLIKGQSITVTANVNNARDSFVDWLGDSCLSISSQSNTATINANNCNPHPVITGRLHNGAKDTLTLNYEDTLSYTVKNSSGTTLSPDSDGNYKGNNFVITTSTNANMTFKNSSGSQIAAVSNATQFNLNTQGWQGAITITTPCGQSKTISIIPEIN